MRLTRPLCNKVEEQPKTLRVLVAGEYHRVAGGALTALGTNLSSSFKYTDKESSADQRISLTRLARLVDY